MHKTIKYTAESGQIHLAYFLLFSHLNLPHSSLWQQCQLIPSLKHHKNGPLLPLSRFSGKGNKPTSAWNALDRATCCTTAPQCQNRRHLAWFKLSMLTDHHSPRALKIEWQQKRTPNYSQAPLHTFGSSWWHRTRWQSKKMEYITSYLWVVGR